MAPTTETPDRAGDDRINELYWHSERTIGDITDDLGVSRNALYTSIHPLSAGAKCPDCGDEVVYTNRTHRDAGSAVCSECGVEVDMHQDADAAPTGGSRSRYSHDSAHPSSNGNGHPEGSGWTRWRDDLASVEPERYALVGGAAALGVMVGAAAAKALRERM